MSLGSSTKESRAASFADDDSRWQAMERRDRTADNVFFYGVTTTGVYCRPSCPSRQAKREHVQFFETTAAAERAGYRPCKRCSPNTPSLTERQRDTVAQACRLLDDATGTPDLTCLAASAGLSRFHFHRIFKNVTGVTPKAYAAGRRAERVRANLRVGASVTDALYRAGFASSGPFYASAAEHLGMTPSAYRAGGAGMTMHFAVGECSLGTVLVAATDRGICAIFLGDDPDALARELQDRFRQAKIIGGDADFERWMAEGVALVEQPAVSRELPLDICGTAFQVRVWQALRRIPAGSTTTYTEIAAHIGQPKAARAVAGACAANPIAIAIPCHRVVRSDESLSGYRWGVERKAELLRRELPSIGGDLITPAGGGGS